ncbi:MAG: YesL family protein [Pseudobutyrivibrio sp.]|nr:YesL family protein [Pseudobutyrivibrio sp.]
MLTRFFESRFFTFLGKAVDVILLSLLWCLTSLPVFTIGASTVALYYTIHKCVYQDRDYCFKTYFVAFKDNFKQATLTWFIMLAVGLIFAYDTWFCQKLKEQGDVIGNMTILFLVFICLLVIWAVYTLLYMARFSNGFKATLKVGAGLAILHFGTSLVVLITTALFAACAYVLKGSLILIPGVYMVALHPAMEKIFRSVMSEEDGALEDARNGVYTRKED